MLGRNAHNSLREKESIQLSFWESVGSETEKSSLLEVKRKADLKNFLI